MNGMNEAITSLPFYAGISFGIFSRAMEIDSKNSDEFFAQPKRKVTEIFSVVKGKG